MEPAGPIPVARQCELLGLPRASFYYQPATETAENLELMNWIDREHTAHPFVGVLGMSQRLARAGLACNPKRVRRLMRAMGIEAVYPRPRTSAPGGGHRLHPYLMAGLGVVRPNQAWCSDITFVPMPNGFMYLAAVMDWASRFVLSWELSNTLAAVFCQDALDAAFATFDPPEVFNSDQGAQYTCEAFQQRLAARNVLISMDGRGRALDNVFVERLWRSVKYEDVYLNCYDNARDLRAGLRRYFRYYCHERPHQGLGGRTPAEVYGTCP